jgi:hypothetical protein
MRLTAGSRTAARETTEDELRPVTYQHVLQTVKNTEPTLSDWMASSESK